MNTITSALASLWAACGSEWAAMGRTGQAWVLAAPLVAYFALSLVWIWWETRQPMAGPDDVTDANHSPMRSGLDWTEEQEARFWAEKEQAG